MTDIQALNRKAKCEKRGKIHEQRRADKRERESARKALLRHIDNINKYGVPYAEKGWRKFSW